MKKGRKKGYLLIRNKLLKEGGSFYEEKGQDILRNEKVFVGLEDSKKTWQLCVRSGGVIVHETSMPAKFEVLRNYFDNRFPECQIQVIYEAGFKGFELHDELEEKGWDCIVTPPHTFT